MRKNLKKVTRILSLFMVFTLCFSIITFASDAKDFTDVPGGAWYYDELTYATGKGLINGTSSTTFSPDSTMSRGQFITIIGRLFGEEVTPGTAFSDVDNTKWYAGYTYWGVAKGIIKGTSSSTFEPDADISRQDMATIIGRVLDVFNYELDDADDAVAAFSDANTISSYAAGYCEMLRRAGLLKGGTDGNMDPKRSMTRAEGMVIIVRLAKAINIGTEERVPSVEENHSHNFYVTSQTQPTTTLRGVIWYECACGESKVEYIEKLTDDRSGVDIEAARVALLDYIVNEMDCYINENLFVANGAYSRTNTNGWAGWAVNMSGYNGFSVGHIPANVTQDLITKGIECLEKLRKEFNAAGGAVPFEGGYLNIEIVPVESKTGEYDIYIPYQ